MPRGKALTEKYSGEALLHVAAIRPLTSYELANYKTLPIDEKLCRRKSGRCGVSGAGAAAA